MLNFNISEVDQSLKNKLISIIDNKTKPLKSLGQLEKLAIDIGCLQYTCNPQINNPYVLVFAGDHGIVNQGVTLYPQEVTAQMVYNFLGDGAAINVISKTNSLNLKIIDAGVAENLSTHAMLINAKIGYGTNDFFYEAAMTEEEFNKAIEKGSSIVENLYEKEGCNLIAFGEMGIGNSSSASILTSLITHFPLDSCTGSGTGLSQDKVMHKMEILAGAIGNYKGVDSPDAFLQWFGGFEMVMMCGAMLKAAEKNIIIMIDGFICTAVYLVAASLYPELKDYCIFSHKSAENGHHKILSYLDVHPLLNLNMKLGEGSGAALAFPLLQNAVAILNDMASFDDAGVSREI